MAEDEHKSTGQDEDGRGKPSVPNVVHLARNLPRYVTYLLCNLPRMFE